MSNPPCAEAGTASTMTPAEIQVAFDDLTKRVCKLEQEHARDKKRADEERAAWKGALGWLKQLAEN